MRKTFPVIVERGRDAVGDYKSPKGASYGRFVLRKPPMGPRMRVIICDGEGWDHVSASFRSRCPTWDEMCWVKDLFFESEECVIQYHPPTSQYVNNFPHCLHLWKPHGVQLPMPPKEFV